jgi:hypothetical protein
MKMFCRNLANQAGTAYAGQMRQVLVAVEGAHEADDDRLRELKSIAATTLVGIKAPLLVNGINRLSSTDPIAELGNLNYLDWFWQRFNYWCNQRVEDIDAEELLRDVALLSTDRLTRIDGMDPPLAAKCFSSMGLHAFAVPDRHTTPILNLLQLRVDAPMGSLIHIAQTEDRSLSRQGKFSSWLQDHGGLWPLFLSRLIYMIETDDFALTGKHDLRRALGRRKIVRDALLVSELIAGRYAVTMTPLAVP